MRLGIPSSLDALCALAILSLLSAFGGVPALASGSNDSLMVRAYITNFGGDGITVVDPMEGRVVGHIKTGTKPHGVAIAADGTAVYVSNEADGTLSVIDPASNRVTATIAVGQPPNQIATSADGRTSL